MRGRRFPDTAGIAGAVLRSGKPCIEPEVRGGQGRSLSEIDRAADAVVRSLMAAPLKVEDRTFGVIEAVNRIVKIGFGIMGGFNQAQAHAQFVSDIVDFGLDVQQSLEVGRFTKATFSGCDVDVEALVPEATRQALAAMGHQVRTIPPRSGTFGYGQAVMSDGACVHFAGSEPRPDGAAIPEGPKVFKGGEK